MEQLAPIIRMLAEHGLQDVYPVIIATALRPLGLLFGFVAMTWAIGAARMLRVSLAIAIGLPMLVTNADAMEVLIKDGSITRLAIITPKEFLIGYGLGLLASLPFLALQFAGEITDAFRGESDSGLTDPAGGALSTFGALYMIIGLAAFFTFGGMWQLVANLYRSYDIWPMEAALPSLAPSAAVTVLQILSETLLLAVQVAVPLLAALVVIEFTCGIAARMAKRFSFYENAFLFKNLAAVLSLPLVGWFVWLLSESLVGGQIGGLVRLEALFP